MTHRTEEKQVAALLEMADVKINGDRPFDIRVDHPDFFPRIAAGGSMALGESYMDGWWRCGALDQFFERILSARLDQKARNIPALWWLAFKSKMTGSQSRHRAFEIGQHHYDIGNDLFRAMLDKRLNYSCAYWRDAADLDTAQEAKLDMTCRKLKLEPGMRVLDIGCGWGGFAVYAAETYGVEVTGISVSREQVQFAQGFSRNLPVRFMLMDYREVEDRFDRIVSIGMFEHVGVSKYPIYMQTVHRCLKPGGLFLLHTIGGNRSVRETDPWIAKYIFPNSMLPSAAQIASAVEGLFILEDWHSFGVHYDPTLMAWYRNVTDNWHLLEDAYDDRFFRMWTYYLLASAGAFRARRNQLWQIVFSKSGVKGGYQPLRT